MEGGSSIIIFSSDSSGSDSNFALTGLIITSIVFLIIVGYLVFLSLKQKN